MHIYFFLALKKRFTFRSCQVIKNWVITNFAFTTKVYNNNIKSLAIGCKKKHKDQTQGFLSEWGTE